MDGYFVHFFAPEGYEPAPMDVLFVLDKSGSMGSGNKMQQLKQAMNRILDDVKGRDRFGILMFDHSVRFWKPTLVYADKDNIAEAKSYVAGIYSGGGILY